MNGRKREEVEKMRWGLLDNGERGEKNRASAHTQHPHHDV